MKYQLDLSKYSLHIKYQFTSIDKKCVNSIQLNSKLDVKIIYYINILDLYIYLLYKYRLIISRIL